MLKALVIFLISGSIFSVSAEAFQCRSLFSGDKNTLSQNSRLLKPHVVSIAQTADLARSWALNHLTMKVFEKSLFKDRLESINSLPIGFLIAAPGHNILRNKKQIQDLKEYIKNNNQGDFSKDPILLNIITNQSGQIESVDIWNAHHRLVAYQELNYQTISDINKSNLKILVNGVASSGEKWNHYVPAAGLSAQNLKQYQRARESYDVQPNTIIIPGHISNYALSSKTTLKDLGAQVQPKRIAVYLGTFDPVHEGHIATIKSIVKQLNFDEAILIHNMNPVHKPNATPSSDRLQMLNIRIQNESKLNVFQDDSGFIINEFGKDLLIEQIKQTYATSEIYEVLGDDAYQTLMDYGQIKPTDNRKYVVMSRSPEVTVNIPDHLKEQVIEAQSDVVTGLSSTLIRKKIQNNEGVDAGIMFPEVLEYIQKKNLYKTMSPLKDAS